MRAVLLSLLGMFGLLDTAASKHVVWQHAIQVFDHSAPVYGDVVERKVSALGAIMPKDGPPVRYQRRPYVACERLKPHPKAITVCSFESDDSPDYHAEIHSRRGITDYVVVRLPSEVALWPYFAERTELESLVLHELSHAIYDTSERVAGWSPEPTEAMRKKAHQMYGGRERESRHGNHAKHRH